MTPVSAESLAQEAADGAPSNDEQEDIVESFFDSAPAAVEAEYGCGEYWSAAAPESLEEVPVEEVPRETEDTGEDFDEVEADAALALPEDDLHDVSVEEIREAFEDIDESDE